MRKSIKLLLLLRPLLAAALVGTGGLASATERWGLEAALESITTADLERHVSYLADDALEGREAGSRGGRAAAAYLKKVLAATGAKGGGAEGSYTQPFAYGYCNVLARLDGSDPSLAGEWIVVGAHYDHVGYGTRRNSYGPIGVVHNGADDNASGTSAILELVEAFARLGRAPRRSILFALWDGEEKGLLGSKHWVANPTVPLKHVQAAIILDMVGRLRDGRLEVIGTRTGWGMRRRLSEATDGADLWLDLTWRLAANGDHWSLIDGGIPTILLHTGLHDEFHRPSDDAHLINSQGMREIVHFLFRHVRALADADQLRGFRAIGRRETSAMQRWRERHLPPLAPRLGVAWRRDTASGEGAELTRVVPGSAAAVAGLRPGDRIVALAGQPLRDGEQLRAAVLAIEAEAPLVIERPGASDAAPERLELTVSLAGRPVRVGISWREDDAEPGSVMLTRVVPGSTADRAGLAAGDRVYQIGGEDFSAGVVFGQKLAQASGPVELLVERRGRIWAATLAPAPINTETGHE